MTLLTTLGNNLQPAEIPFELGAKQIQFQGSLATFNLLAPRIYAVLYVDGFFGLAPTALQIKEGKDPVGALAIWSGVTTPISISGTFDWPSVVTGLTLNEGEALRYSILWTDGTTDSEVYQSDSFLPAASVIDLNLEPKQLVVTCSPVEFFRVLQINLESKTVQIQGTIADFDRSILLNLEPKNLQVQGFAAEYSRSLLLNLEPSQIRVQGFNTVDRKDYVLNLEPKSVDVNGFDTTEDFGRVTALDSGQLSLQGFNTVEIRSIIFNLEPKSIAVQGYDTDGATELVFPLGSKQVTTQGFDLGMQVSRVVNLEPGNAQVQGFAAEIAAHKYVNLESQVTQLQRFDATLQLDRILPALAKQMLVQGFDADFASERFLNLESRQTRVQGFSATFIGSYVYPDPQFVKYGVTYGPSGTDFVGAFTFKPSFDLMTGNFVLPESYRTFAFGREINLTVLTADLVAEGVIYGISQTGTSKGYLSYDVNTARIARPVADNALVVV